MEVGETFKPGLLHVTIVTWFVSDLDDDELIKSFKKEFAERKAFRLSLGKIIKFGRKKNIPANLIRYSEEIIDLHGQALDWMGRLRGRWAVKNPYMAEDYKPHIRRRPGTKIKEGDDLEIEYLYLISANRTEDNIRTVAAKVRLNEQN